MTQHFCGKHTEENSKRKGEVLVSPCEVSGCGGFWVSLGAVGEPGGKGLCSTPVVARTATAEGLGSVVPVLLGAIGTGGGSCGGGVRAWCRVFVRTQQSCQPLMTGLSLQMPLFYPQSQALLNTARQFVGYRQSLYATPRCNMEMLRAVFAVMSWQ